MSDVIPVSFGARWGAPVCLVQKRAVKRIKGPAEAIRFMKTDFRERSGTAYSRAVAVCFAALRRETEPDVARHFFLAAYESELRARSEH
ncbi:DUF982 domain-containing protein [Neorhizobium sp. S3-V5DH]|jgi:hypothetical protein|uniref:DUF982 domain-containing protein n=1 Tax=Neorhizobium sp. S3-V5DH TaxID=2485166 RepID=UPI00105231D3|nr:DUF982 domain-containing protein [Neorhizobium sp. S3-V5DH]